MEEILRELELRTSWKEAMRKCCRSNKLNVDLVSYFTPLRFRAAYAKFKAIYEKRSQDKTERWLENELKAFYWMTVALSCTAQLNISQFTSPQWQTLSTVFYFKQATTLEYEGRKLVEDAANKANWEPQEETMLAQIVKDSEDNANKWNEFARKLFETSAKLYFRTGKQCRQRWLNHLDPSKKHGEWTEEEDRQVVRLFLSEGKKWSQVAKKLGSHRTEHMVKNRYKTILARQRKLHPKITSEATLLKSFLDPNAVLKYLKREQLTPTPTPTVKTENRSQEPDLPDLSNPEEEEENEEEPAQPADKNLPQTSTAFDLPSVFSPWYLSIPITPTFSPSVPFFVNIPTFSTFQANFSNQFYCPRKSSEKLDHP